MKESVTCADPENFLRGGGGGGVQIPRRGLTEIFNMAKINDLAIPGGGGGGSDPLSPSLDPPMAVPSTSKSYKFVFAKNTV